MTAHFHCHGLTDPYKCQLHGKVVVSKLLGSEKALCSFSGPDSVLAWVNRVLQAQMKCAAPFKGPQEMFCKMSPNSVGKWRHSRIIHLISGPFAQNT